MFMLLPSILEVVEKVQDVVGRTQVNFKATFENFMSEFSY